MIYCKKVKKKIGNYKAKLHTYNQINNKKLSHEKK